MACQFICYISNLFIANKLKQHLHSWGPWQIYHNLIEFLKHFTQLNVSKWSHLKISNIRKKLKKNTTILNWSTYKNDYKSNKVHLYCPKINNKIDFWNISFNLPCSPPAHFNLSPTMKIKQHLYGDYLLQIYGSKKELIESKKSTLKLYLLLHKLHLSNIHLMISQCHPIIIFNL